MLRHVSEVEDAGEIHCVPVMKGLLLICKLGEDRLLLCSEQKKMLLGT